MPLLHIIHNFGVSPCSPLNTILGATAGYTKILLRQRGGTGVTPSSPAGQSLIQEVPLRENLQVAILRTNNLFRISQFIKDSNSGPVGQKL